MYYVLMKIQYVFNMYCDRWCGM